MPKKHKFDYFEAFCAQADIARKESQALLDVVENFKPDPEWLRGKMEVIHAIENEGDDIAHEIIERLATEFLPPIDREDVTELTMLLDDVTDEIEETIRGISVPIRRHEYTKAEPNVYRALRLSRMEEGYYEGMIDAVRLCVRVRPDVDNADFPARFRKDMAEQLRLGNLYLLDVQPLSYIRDGYIRSIGVENEVKTRVAVACFLLANIFLGIIGTFWFRTEYRKGEMGLRMALGSTRRQLNSIMVGEGVLLLVLAFIPSLLISFNIAHMDLIDTYQLPFTWLRFAICGGITFVLIVLMIICGVWYPARSTARLEPAEALHYE